METDPTLRYRLETLLQLQARWAEPCDFKVYEGPAHRRISEGRNLLNTTKNNNDNHGWRSWYVAFICAATSAISAATAAQFSATLAPLAAKMGVTEQAIALSDPVKSVIVVIAMLTAPTMIAKKGWRFTFLAGFLTFLIPQLIMPFTSSYAVLLVLKAVQGMSALLFVLMLTLIMEWSSEENMGLATSIFTGAFYAGGVAGGTVAGFAIARWGWESSYHILSAAMVVMAAVFMLTVTSSKNGESAETASGDNGDYKYVVRHRLTWLLVIAFLPTVWTIQAIWADMVPFGMGIGYSETETGSVMGLSAVAIVVASVLSGKTSDFFARRSKNKLHGRVAVFSAGMLMIIAGVVIMTMMRIAPPNITSFNFVVFLLSFGAAWGLGSFYCTFPEFFTENQATVANGFIGGIADMAMPLSPIVMAFLGIKMNLWNLAWLSCVAVAVVGLLSASQVFRVKR